MSKVVRVAGCSYEGSIFGWSIDQTEIPSSSTVNDGEKGSDHGMIEPKMVFGFHVTPSSLRTVAVSRSGRYLAIGGMDERVHLFNMIENKAVGEVTGHSGAINSLKFYNDDILISASEDHTLYIWRVHDWQHLHILGGHKDVVYDFAIHPTGKLALSVSRDHTMRLWNLVQGRAAFTRRLKQNAEQVAWHPDGNSYLLVSQKEVQVFLTSDNSQQLCLSSSSRVNRAEYIYLSDHNEEDTYGIVFINDSQDLIISDTAGKVLVNVNFSTMNIGRLRSMAIVKDEISNKKKKKDKNVVHERAADQLVIVTSIGCMIMLDSAALLNVDETQANDGEILTDYDKISSATVAIQQLKAEPRLTSVVAWVSTDQVHEPAPTSEVVAVVPVVEQNEPEEEVTTETGKRKVSFGSDTKNEEEPSKKKKKNNKKKKGGK